MLGPLEAEVEDRGRVELPARPAIVLAALALASGDVVTVERLVDLLWPDSPPEQARNAVQVHVATIRRALGEDGRAAVESRSSGYRLRTDIATTDLLEFERLRAEADDCVEPADREKLLSDALGLWRGPPLHGLLERGPAHPRIVELEERWMATVEALADVQLELGRPTEIVARLEGLVREHPFREGLAERLARALYQAGRQTDALRVLRRLRADLRDEVGVRPGPAIEELEARILAHDPTLSPVPAGDAAGPPLPDGIVTFLFTDIDGSSAKWERDARAMRLDLRRHDALCADAVDRAGGSVVKTIGDSVMAAFGRPTAAVEAAMAIQRTMSDETWRSDGGIRVRIGLHTGAATPHDGDYHGPAVNVAARLVRVAHAGQVLASAVTVQLAGRSPDIAARALGRYELRGIVEPVEVHQLSRPGLRSDFPPVNAPQIDNTVPRPTTRFVGRHEDLDEVDRLLDDHRIVTVVGAGGMGKTRVAIEVAGRRDTGDTTVHFADLAPREGGAAVLEEICRSAGLSEVSGDPVDALILRLSGRPSLMVLDNCEHVTAHVSAIVDRVTAACRHLSVLATSRVPLGVPGECRHDLPPMPATTDARDLLRMRAREAGCAEPLEDDTAARLCELLDGIPLAIELTAPWLRVLAPEQLVTRLETDPSWFDEPPIATSTSTVTTKTMGQTIRWSVSLLDPSTAELLHGLCEFPAGFTLREAEAYAGIDPTRALGALVDSSLLRTADSRAGRRYRILEPVRAFGTAEASRVGGRAEAQRRQAEVMLGVARDVAEALPTRDEPIARRRLEEELPNLAAAVAWAVVADPGLAVAIVAPLAPLVSFLPAGAARLAVPVADGTDWHELPDGLAVAALAMFARAYLDANPAGVALRAEIEATVADRAGDVDASVAIYLGTMSTVLGDPVGAIQGYARAAELGRGRGDDVTVAEAGMLHAAWCWFARQPGHEQPLAESTALAADLGGPSLVSLCEVVNGFFTIDEEPDVAEDHFRRALAVGAPTGYGPGVAEFMLGLVHARRGDRRAALGLAQASLQRFLAAGLQIEVGMALSGSTAILLALGEATPAQQVAHVVRTHFAPVAAMPGFARYLDAATGPGGTSPGVETSTRNAAITSVLALLSGLLETAGAT